MTARFPQTLRPYQEDAVRALFQAWADGARAPLIVMATGMGKTTVIAEALRRSIDPAYQRALLVAHTEEIVRQLHERVVNQFGGALDRSYGGAPGIGIVMGDERGDSARVVCASRQSLHAARLRHLLSHGAFDVLVIDEAHHATGENTYGDLLEALQAHHPHLRVFGVTATPQRGDGRALGALFDKLAFVYAMPQAIAEGYLTPIVPRVVQCGVDLSAVKTVNGDYHLAQLERALERADWLGRALAAFQKHVPPERRTLAFFPSVDMSRMFTRLLCQSGAAAAHVDGETPREQRRAVLADFRAGRLSVVSNVAVLTEGFDAPHADCIFLARPTRSSALLTQIIGRGVRLHPGKTHCLVLFLQPSDARLGSAVDLLGKTVSCPQCGQACLFGARACPNCGAPFRSVHRRSHSAAAPASDEDEVVLPVLQDSADFYVAHQALFDTLNASWVASGSSAYILSLGSAGTLRAELDASDPHVERWRCFFVPQGGAPELIAVNTEAAACLGQAEAWAASRFPGTQKLIDKRADWRALPATEKQRALISRLARKAPPSDLTRGAASDLINILINRLPRKM